MTLSWLQEANGASPWSEAKVLVTGIGRAGFAAADALLDLGAQVRVVDALDNETTRERAKVLEILDGHVQLSLESTLTFDGWADLIVTSPGWPPSQPLLAQAAAAGVPIWGDVELAWRLMHPDRVVPWLGVTGTNGKTTTTQMLESILQAAGLKVAAVGNIGRPIFEALADEVDYDVFAVELSSFQLHWSHSLSMHSAAVLNIHPDHLEWYNDPADYERDKAKIFHMVRHACVYNVAEPATERMVEEAEVVEGARAIGFTLGIPAMSMLGLVEEFLVDRAFVEQRKTSALELCQLSDVDPPAPHNLENALAAAALARAFGVPATAVKQGLRDMTLGGHRIQTVAVRDGVTWIDDSKATNPHAANSSLRAYESVVWIAGGQAKGTTFDDLVLAHREHLRGVVLIGVDAPVIASALAQHAPEVPVVHVASQDNGTMTEAVATANTMARAGDTVLLAPGCASLDMFSGYAERGDAFASAVRGLDEG